MSKWHNHVVNLKWLRIGQKSPDELVGPLLFLGLAWFISGCVQLFPAWKWCVPNKPQHQNIPVFTSGSCGFRCILPSEVAAWGNMDFKFTITKSRNVGLGTTTEWSLFLNQMDDLLPFPSLNPLAISSLIKITSSYKDVGPVSWLITSRTS